MRGSRKPRATGASREVRICVAVVDGQQLLAEALAALVDAMDGFTMLGVIVGHQALIALVDQRPDLVIARVGDEPGGAVELVRSARSLPRDVSIVLVADVLTSELVRFVLEERLDALILSDCTVQDLAASLDQVAHGQAVLPAGWQSALAGQEDDPLEPLSIRQLEVLDLIAEGCSYHEIASRLFISTNTVKFHLRAIYLQLGVNNRMAAAGILARSRRGRGLPATGRPLRVVSRD